MTSGVAVVAVDNRCCMHVIWTCGHCCSCSGWDLIRVESCEGRSFVMMLMFSSSGFVVSILVGNCEQNQRTYTVCINLGSCASIATRKVR